MLAGQVTVFSLLHHDNDHVRNDKRRVELWPTGQLGLCYRFLPQPEAFLYQRQTRLNHQLLLCDGAQHVHAK